MRTDTDEQIDLKFNVKEQTEPRNRPDKMTFMKDACSMAF